jgi:hypothetical protein
LSLTSEPKKLFVTAGPERARAGHSDNRLVETGFTATPYWLRTAVAAVTQAPEGSVALLPLPTMNFCRS